MRYGSVCSGIEAASVAWAPIGWTPAFFSEIDRFPCEVLAHHYGSNLPGEDLSRNAPPNLGDMTKFQEWPDAAIDVLVGGTPCQSFSVAGLRKGLADPRGNLALTYLGILDRFRPSWMVWENVPGVLSSGGGRDFGSFLGGLGELGYGWAYRVLDAQYVTVDGYGRAVPQRRQRVFVVGYLGDWRRAAAVLLERESLLGNPAPRREAGQGTAAGPGERAAFGGNRQSGAIDVATAINAQGGPAGRLDFESETFIAEPFAPAITSNPYGDHESREGLLVAHTLKAHGFDASEDGTGRGTPIIPIDMRQASRGATMTNNRSEGASGGAPGTGIGEVGDPCPSLGASHTPAIAFDTTQITSKANRSVPKAGDPCHPLAAGAHAPAIAFVHQAGGVQTTLGYDPDAGTAPTLSVCQTPAVHSGWAVRRLTPLECERLQGFPDGYTAIDRKGKPAADGPRYKALGNSMAVNCMRWLGRRIAMVDVLSAEIDREAI